MTPEEFKRRTLETARLKEEERLRKEEEARRRDLPAPNYPRVLSESETLDLVLEGRSLVRFGDGEMGIALGGSNSTHGPNPELTKEFCEMLLNPPEGLVVGIPSIAPGIVRRQAWIWRSHRYAPYFDSSRVYGSAFVGRPKAAPWTGEPEHLARFRSLWKDRDVVGVRPATHPLVEKLLAPTAAKVHTVECPARESYLEIDRLMSECLATGADLAIICAGPGATALACRLHKKGVQAIDLGRGAGAILKRGVDVAGGPY